jgi:hypothetical protein
MTGAAAIIVWGGSACCVMFGTLKFFGQLRVSEEEERKGKTNFYVRSVHLAQFIIQTNKCTTYIYIYIYIYKVIKKSVCTWLLQYQNTQKYFKQFQSLTMII